MNTRRTFVYAILQHMDGRAKNTITVYHASSVVVEKPAWDYASGTDSERNDFGIGFYTSTDADQPLMLLCERSHVVLNRYALTLDGLDVKRIPNDAE